MPKLADGRTVPNAAPESSLAQVGYSQVTPTNAANGTALVSPPTTAHRMVVQCNGGTIRWRADGVAGLNSSLGSLMKDGDTVTLYGQPTIKAFKHFLASGTPVLDIQFWG